MGSSYVVIPLGLKWVALISLGRKISVVLNLVSDIQIDGRKNAGSWSRLYAFARIEKVANTPFLEVTCLLSIY